MKKLVAISVVLVLVAGFAFAEANVSVSGTTRLDFGVDMNFGNDADDSASQSWIFGDGDAIIGVTGTAGPVSANVTFQGSGGGVGLDGWYAAANISPVELKVGFGYLPWVQWSALDFYGDNNWGFGASAVKDNFFQVKFGTDSFSLYLGLMAEGVNAQTMKDNATFPGFYIGTDFGQDKFSAGVAFAGVVRGKGWKIGEGKEADWGKWFADNMADILADNEPAPFPIGTGPAVTGETRFGWMGNVHANFNFDPMSLGINIGLYGDPVVSDSYITPGNALEGGIGSKKDFILEAQLSLGIGLDACKIDFTTGFVGNFAPKGDGGGATAIRIGADTQFTLGGGFSLIPGIIYTIPLSAPGGGDAGSKGVMNIGVSMGYSF